MKKHFEGKYHKNKELANKYENELIERQIQEEQKKKNCRASITGYTNRTNRTK